MSFTSFIFSLITTLLHYNQFQMDTIKSWPTFFILVQYPVSFRSKMGCKCSFMFTLNSEYCDSVSDCVTCCRNCGYLEGAGVSACSPLYFLWSVRLALCWQWPRPLCMMPPLMWPGLQGKRETLSLKGLRSLASCCECVFVRGLFMFVCVRSGQ